MSDDEITVVHKVLYHPDRVIQPLKRIGKRGEGNWHPISWNEALDLMACRFSEIRERHAIESKSTITEENCNLHSLDKEAPFGVKYIISSGLGY